MDQERTKQLYEDLPTVPMPNLEEIKIAAEIERELEQNSLILPACQQSFELGYRKGRLAGKSAATKEILGRP